ncbi:MAG TPA: hypothetical protein VKU87_03655 [Thermomicrobiaceae bacterium]|nr:hypothetical protein [Thermomicrobiaceae bacterium]
MDGAKRTSHDANQPGRTFDPRPHLRRIESRRGQPAEYLDVKWRLVWLRTEHPEARIKTEHMELTEERAVFRATVELPEGGSASGYGSQSSRDFPEFIEAAETKAIGRALAALGFGTQFALDFDLEGGDDSGEARHDRAPADAPVELRSRPSVSKVEPEPAVSSPEPAEQAARRPAHSSRVQETEHEPSISQHRDRPAIEILSPVPKPTPQVETMPDADDDEAFDPANYSWTQFWYWARGLGYNSKAGLEEMLGVHDLLAHTPREAREMLRSYRSEQGLD